MTYDRKIIISAAGSRKATTWPAQELWLSELYDRLRTPTRSTETLAEYLALKKSQQDSLKDVGGFVAGVLRGNRRKGDAVTGRDVLTLDLDNIPAGGTEDILRRVESLGCGYCIYSTRKHSPAAPRLRVLLPLDRTVTADEYEPLARKAAQLIDPGMTPFDATTFQPCRLMYWPSCCSDAEYMYLTADKPMVSADGLLGMYTDWRSCTEWPQVPGALEAHRRLADKQDDPTTKKGTVGAFCRVYDIYAAIERFLPGLYTPVDGVDNRYTYTGGSTTGGAVIYDNGLFLYSHHGTDPVGGRLVNAFDLVRLHRFGELDDEAKPDTPPVKLPSYAAMRQLATQDEGVAALLDRERYEAVQEEFSGVPASPAAPEDTSWMRQLQRNESGRFERTIKNALLVLQHHPQLAGRIRYNNFADNITGIAPLPWPGRAAETGEFIWRNADDSGLRDYVERFLGFHSKDVIEDALQQVAVANSYNPVADYLNSQQWDGIDRLDTLYIDYFGAEDNEYTRAVTRKAFVAAVARALEPGTKFDQMTVICGPQGIGKTTFFKKMGRDWFSNSVTTFDGKEAAELLQGVWIVEIGELEAFNKADVRAVKQFLSRQDDQYRAAYARRAEKRLRKCVFFGTTNDREYLKDPTGNRRFWPVDAGAQAPTKSVFSDLTGEEIGQVWAEAVVRYRVGESLILPAALEAEAEKSRELHTESDELKGQIEDFLSRSVPADWLKWDKARRDLFWGGGMKGATELVPRDRVCVMEVFRECLHDYRAVIPKRDSNRVAAVLASLPGWERAGVMRFGCEYGRQMGFRAIENVNQPRQSSREIASICQSTQKTPVNYVNLLD